MEKRKVILYISMSLDGFLATEDDGLDWLTAMERPGEDYGYVAFNETVDAYIVGRKTYDVVMGLTGGKFPAASVHDCYVITRQQRPPENGVTFYSGNIKALVQKLRSQSGKNIYCDGGGQIVSLLLQSELIDEFIISVIPIILGNGKRLFNGGTPTIPLRLISSRSFESGLVQLHYERP